MVWKIGEKCGGIEDECIVRMRLRMTEVQERREEKERTNKGKRKCGSNGSNRCQELQKY